MFYDYIILYNYIVT